MRPVFYTLIIQMLLIFLSLIERNKNLKSRPAMGLSNKSKKRANLRNPWVSEFAPFTFS